MDICRYQKAFQFRERCQNFHDNQDFEYWKTNPRRNFIGRKNRKEEKREDHSYLFKLTPNKTHMIREKVSNDKNTKKK